MTSRVISLALVAVLLTALSLCAQPSSTQSRLAIIAEQPEMQKAADVLAVELSRQPGLELLERTKVAAIYREQALSSAGRNLVALGQVLSADGLLMMESKSDGTSIQLVAIEQGVVLCSGNFSAPTNGLSEWAAAVNRYLRPFLPKLDVKAVDAVPISILNLRSAIQSEEAREAEEQLTLLAIERLSRERLLFILERRRMQMLTSEKELNGLDESTFWEGAYLLEGTLDNNGYSPQTITLSARLIPRKGGAPVTIEVSGSRSNFTEVINRLADRILEGVKLEQSTQPWNAGDEAAQFHAEAQWAMKWGLYAQAQTATESAWALGKRDADTALLSVRAHSENVPMGRVDMSVEPDSIAQDNIYVPTIPAAAQLEPLAHALAMFHQNTRLLLTPTNARAAGFETGVQLLRRAAGVLESFYYAAEARAGHEEELANLRQGMRDVIGDLDAHPPGEIVRHWRWNDPRLQFQWLKWNEGGICAEEPESALPMAHQLLAGGYQPASLPRVVGWSWASRQRVPGLERQFVNDVCASTNQGVRLQGLYLAMLQAPEGERGSRWEAEDKLIAAMWEKRDWLCSDADRVSLVARSQRILIRRHDDSGIGYFSFEPFASFKHNLRMDYVARFAGTNLAVFQALFPNTNVKQETPDQARELLPVVESLKQRVPSPGTVAIALQKLQHTAGEKVPLAQAMWQPHVDTNASNLVEAKYIHWNLTQRDDSAESKPRIGGLIERNGLLWSRVQCLRADTWDLDPEVPIRYVAVNPRTGVEMEISFPLQFGVPGGLFEVSSNAIYVEARGRLYVCPLTQRDWKEIPVPMEGVTQMIWAKGRLMVCRNDGLMEVQPESLQVRLLVSSRRHPAVNAIDPLWTPTTRLFTWQDGRLGALTENHCLTLDPLADKWEVREVSLARTNNQYPQKLWFTSGHGAQLFMGRDSPGNDYLIGFWDDTKPSETLLANQTAMLFRLRSTNMPPPVFTRWDWPQTFALAYSSVAVGDHKLAIFCPRKIWPFTYSPQTQEFAKFSDNRHATLLQFEPGFTTPLKVGVRLQDDGRTDRPVINGTQVEMFHPLTGGFASRWDRFSSRGGPEQFWLETSAGLVFGAPNYRGHWLISKESLERPFEDQRNAIRQSAPTRTSAAATPNKP
jgi:hypothetical protein